MYDKDSLLSQIFKSRYFLNSEFLNAPNGTRPSYAWRSILFGRKLLSEGLQRVIGNGKSTSVWIDKWLFDGHRRRPMNSQIMIDIKLKVNQLIDPISQNWNLNMLRDLFPWKDIQIILKLHPLLDREDSYCWALTSNGLYSVKSGYELISRKVHHSLFCEAETNPSLNPLFVSVWKMKTAPKIKVFLWKALRGAIAVEDRLRTRGIQIEDGCLMCQEANESINHILFQCPLARQVWALSLLQSPGNGFGNSIFTNMDHVIQTMQNQERLQHLRNVSPWIMWFIWKNMNKLLFEGNGSLVQNIVEKAYEECNQWNVAQSNGVSSLESVQTVSKKWLPPKTSEVKCNIGFAWSRQKQMAGVAWVVRDSYGTVLLHSRRSYSQVLSLLDAKLKSWDWALNSMIHHKMDNVLFGASTYEIIQALHKLEAWPAMLGHIDVLMRISKNKPNWFMVL